MNTEQLDSAIKAGNIKDVWKGIREIKKAVKEKARSRDLNRFKLIIKKMRKTPPYHTGNWTILDALEARTEKEFGGKSDD